MPAAPPGAWGPSWERSATCWSAARGLSAPRLTGLPPVAAFNAADSACLLLLLLLLRLGLQKVLPGCRRRASAAGPAAGGLVSHGRLLPGGREGRLGV